MTAYANEMKCVSSHSNDCICTISVTLENNNQQLIKTILVTKNNDNNFNFEFTYQIWLDYDLFFLLRPLVVQFHNHL